MVFGSGFAISIVMAALLAVLPAARNPAINAALVGSMLAYAVGCAWMLNASKRKRLRLDQAFFRLAVGTVSLVGLMAMLMGAGLQSPALGFIPFCVVLTCTVTHFNRAGWLAAWATVQLCMLALGEWLGYLPEPASELPLVLRFGLHALVILASVAAGRAIAGVLAHTLRVVAEREKRFSGLLAISVDMYWEMDADCVIRHVSRRTPDNRFIEVSQPNLAPWDQPELLCDAEAREPHFADLRARRPFRNLRVHAQRLDGSPSIELTSGEPRFDRRGVFIGYWGVAIDITTDTEVKRSLAAFEDRYRQLFARSPSPLLLHRHGRIVEANTAAARLLGAGDVALLINQPLRDFFSPDDHSLADSLLAPQSSELPSIEPPTREFRMQSLDGSLRTVEATATSVETDTGVAILSILLDQTEQRRSQAQLRRSQDLLSNLVDISPDIITLTELDTGRYTMVNRTFTRVTGYTAEEVLGRTSTEIGIWHDPADRHRLISQLNSDDATINFRVTLATKSGALVPARISAAKFALEGRGYLVVNGRDIRADELARLEREAILDNLSLGILFVRAGVLVQVNKTASRMLGWPADELTGQDPSVVWPANIQTDTQTQVAAVLARGEAIDVVHQMQRRNGSLFWCRIMAKALNPDRPNVEGAIWIVEDITERRRVEQALAQARDDAEAANRAKSAFLANTSHELRTPLNALIGLARLAQSDRLDNVRRQQYLDQIAESAQTLAEIISDILDLSKIEAGKMHVEAQPFGLSTVLEPLVRGYSTLAAERGLRLTLELAPDLPERVVGDALRLRQVLANFLSNALKFTHHGDIRLSVARVQGHILRFEVHDTGGGIDEVTQARLFQPFTQGDQSTTRRYGGTGLGLSISQDLVRLMGGRLGVVSALGEGSQFWIELPLPETACEPPSPEPALGPDSGLAGLRVLLVEDNPVNMMIGVAIMEQWGVHVEMAADGHQALEAVARAKRETPSIDIVLMDLQMPTMSGHDAAKRLRELHDSQALPIVALTAAALTVERDQALAVGMNDFLTKPIEPKRLHDVLSRWSKHRAAHDR